MHPQLRLVCAVAMLLAGATSGPAHAGRIAQGYRTADGRTGGIVVVVHSLDSARRASTKNVEASCNFRVDTPPSSPMTNDVLLIVHGHAAATVDAGALPALSVRPVATEIQCYVRNDAGIRVFDQKQAESGAVAPLARVVTIRNDGPYQVCVRADTKYEDGTDVTTDYACTG